MINILIFIIALLFYGLLLRIFGYSYKTFIQVVINAILGLIALYVLKLIEIPIQINWISIIITAFFGLPGVVIITIFSNWKGNEMITDETRRESYQKIIPKQPVRYDQIIYILRNNPKGMTAKEIAVKLYELKLIPSTERNFVSPRLTELVKQGKVETIGKRVCQYSNRKVAVFKVV